MMMARVQMDIFPLNHDSPMKTMKWLIQVRLLLEKGANVEGNIDLDLDILSETPLQVLLYLVTISMKWSSWEFSWELSGQHDVKTKIFWNHSSSLLPPVASRLWNFFSVLEPRPSCPLWRWESPSPSWWSPWSLTWLSWPCPFLPTLKEAILTFPYIFITRSTRCPLAPPPRKVATVPCPLLPAMDRGKFFFVLFFKNRNLYFYGKSFQEGAPQAGDASDHTHQSE